MRASSNVTRREFLETAAVAGAGLVIGFHIPAGARFGPTPAAPFTPNAWLRINPDESVLVIVDRSEMGQGVTTSLPMLLAEIGRAPSELQSQSNLVCRLLLEKKKKTPAMNTDT